MDSGTGLMAYSLISSMECIVDDDDDGSLDLEDCIATALALDLEFDCNITTDELFVDDDDGSLDLGDCVVESDCNIMTDELFLIERLEVLEMEMSCGADEDFTI